MNAGLGAVINGDENGVVVSQSPKKGETVSPGEDITLTFEVTDSGNHRIRWRFKYRYVINRYFRNIEYTDCYNAEGHNNHKENRQNSLK